jgi:hypothetical protein
MNNWTYTPTYKWSPLNLKTYDNNGKTSNKRCKIINYYYDVDYAGKKYENLAGREFDGIKVCELEVLCKNNGIPMTEGVSTKKGITQKKIKYTYGDLSKYYMKC